MSIIADERTLKQYQSLGKDLISIFSTIQEELLNGTLKNPLEIEERVKLEVDKLGATPTFIGYNGYPYATCISVNEGVVHNFPTNRMFEAGDVVSVDIGITRDGWIVDCAFTFGIFPLKKETWDFLERSYRLMQAGCQAVRPNMTVEELSSAIEKEAKSLSLTIIPQFTGHALGRELHEDPLIPNIHTPDKSLLVQGMPIAVEPITTMGSAQVDESDDGWTVTTSDGAFASHYEQTILVGSPVEVITPLEAIWDRQQREHKKLA